MKFDILYPEDGGYTFLRNVVTAYKNTLRHNAKDYSPL
jgi:hypothetical protein